MIDAGIAFALAGAGVTEARGEPSRFRPEDRSRLLQPGAGMESGVATGMLVALHRVVRIVRVLWHRDQLAETQ